MTGRCSARSVMQAAVDLRERLAEIGFEKDTVYVRESAIGGDCRKKGGVLFVKCCDRSKGETGAVAVIVQDPKGRDFEHFIFGHKQTSFLSLVLRTFRKCPGKEGKTPSSP